MANVLATPVVTFASESLHLLAQRDAKGRLPALVMHSCGARSTAVRHASQSRHERRSCALVLMCMARCVVRQHAIPGLLSHHRKHVMGVSGVLSCVDRF